MDLQHIGRQHYEQRYGTPPQVMSQAPGRVEILGNHTDYNGGFVLTAALDKFITLHGERRDEPFVTLASATLDREVRFSVDALEHDPENRWADYVKGVLSELRAEGVEFGGFRAVIHSTLPLGEGLSSSAALEAATALFVQALYPFDMRTMDLARLCKHAENRFVGMPCGILDQFSALFGRPDSMLYLDCDTLEYEVFPLPAPVPAVVLCQSGVKHQLVDSEYRTRRRQCEAAAATFGQKLGRTVRFLRDVSPLDYIHLADILDNVLRLRAGHVVFENRRVQDGAEALRKQDLHRLGSLMRESHESSRSNFENSCPELDILVEEAVRIEGCYGSKLTGGGFGGSTVNLVAPDRVDGFCQVMAERYEQRVGRPCKTLVCGMAQGAHVVRL